MLPRVIWTRIPLVRHSELTFSLRYSIAARTPPISSIGIKAPSQARLNFATTTTRFLTDADRARERAYKEAFVKALDQLPLNDPDRIRKAFTAAGEAHPIHPAVHRLHLNVQKIDDGFDGIEEALSDRNLKADAPWGMALYRTAYGDEAAWRHMVARIKGSMERSVMGWDDIRARHQLVVMDDRSQFDGATIDQVRTHFRAWSLEELKRNWRHPPLPEEELAKIEASTFGPDEGAGLRYNYCLVVDDLCLESVERMRSPVLKLVDKGWKPYDPDELPMTDESEEDENPGWEGGVTNSEYEWVGWMYIDTNDYVEIQDLLQESCWWPDMYVRPPLMRGG
ncbi:uncharacterized protein B0H64DRAFT_395717 [Chaetomium fimeti]|uniref:Uncharacterized protein n=1 Tax=Chaetomium fimeti TaxID=1854472 RepID=A0AAE0LS83_9PEZI|nr:hypothetical protein B0H64DRAFT_395717 [Chaetomium fimeti]